MGPFSLINILLLFYWNTYTWREIQLKSWDNICRYIHIHSQRFDSLVIKNPTSFNNWYYYLRFYSIFFFIVVIENILSPSRPKFKDVKISSTHIIYTFMSDETINYDIFDRTSRCPCVILCPFQTSRRREKRERKRRRPPISSGRIIRR